MPLSVGDKLGHYEVLSLLGKGGMGEVYRARDTTLKRDVALKVLPATFLRDPERMARFQREAEVLASLDHPNIGHIYGIADAADSRALVLALIEGPTLEDRIAAGPIPLDEAVAISKQIIEALEYAHDRGIVHRDLKPANINTTSEGVVKVLDFGLAKVLEDEPPLSSLSNSPTLTIGHTRTGVILGTAAYMSPEQAVGRPVDRRSDIFSFGAVLYEMLTGKRAFIGAATPDVLEAVVKNDPDWSALPAATPTYLRRLLERMLVKDRKQRLQAIGEARIALENPDRGESGLETVPSQSRFSWAGWAVAGLITLALAALAVIHLRETPAEQRSYRFQIPPPPGTRFTTFRLSPDGRWVAYIASGEANSGGDAGQLWIRALDSLESHAVPGAEGATYPFWSADSVSVGFFANGKLKRIAAAGGPVQIVCDVSSGRGGTWNLDGTILFADGPGGPILRVAAAGGKPTPLPGDTKAGHRWPEFLPDGKHFLDHENATKPDEAGIYVGSLDGGEPLRLLPDESNATYVRSEAGHDGHVLFRREGVLMAAPFDASRLRVTGEAFPVAENVGVAANLGYAAFSSAGDGPLALWSENASAVRELMWMDRAGKRLGAAGKADSFFVNASPRLSPDEKTVAVTVVRNQTDGDIWFLELAGKTLSRFTFGPEGRDYPVWSPDGRYLLYRKRNGFAYDIVRKPMRGGAEETLLSHGVNATPTDWSPDGKTILDYLSGAKTGFDLALLPVEGERKNVPYLQTPANEFNGVFSPDGRWIAYQSDEGGQNQIYVQSAPVSGAKFQISTAGGTSARWSRDGREIFYLSPDQKIMAAAVKINGASFEAATPQALFAAAGARGFAVTRDGLRFLVNVPAGGEAVASGPPLTVITNWTAGLKK